MLIAERIESEPIFFAHRGGMADAEENTIEAFILAIASGSTGLESDAWITADRKIILQHSARFGPFYKRRLFEKSNLADIPARITSLDSFYKKIKGDYHFSIDVKATEAGTQIIDTSMEHNFPLKKLWLCHSEVKNLKEWREVNPNVRLVNSSNKSQITEGYERRLANLSKYNINALNLHFSEWNEGLTALCHRFGVRCFAWDVQEVRQFIKLFKIGIDGVFSDHTTRMLQTWKVFSENSY